MRRRTIGSRFVTNAFVVVVSIYVAAFFISTFASSQAVQAHENKNLEVLRALHDELDNKAARFLSIVFPLYDESANYELLTTLLESPAEESAIASTAFRERVAGMMNTLASRDDDIEAILVFKSSNGEKLVYDTSYRTLEPATAGFPFFDKMERMEPGRTVHGLQSWQTGERRQINAFGIGSTLGTQTIRMEAGSLVVAYSIEAFGSILDQFYHNDPPEARFLIAADTGGYAFDSAALLQTLDPPRLPDDFVSTAIAIDQIVLDGIPHRVESLVLRGESTGAVYVEPVGVIRALQRRSKIIVFGLCTVLAVIAVALFGRSASILSRRVHQLDAAMDRIGAHDLSHRIPVETQDDELAHIANSFNRMCDELQGNIEKLYVNEIRKKSAELDALQASINPHFLFNSLQAACAKARKNGDTDVADFLVLLANLLRGIVRSDTFVTVRKEMEFCGIYVELFRIRYGDTFEYQVDMDDEAAMIGMPKNVLQPIIENYFVHGMRREDDNNTISIRVRLEGGAVEFRIRDNGRGIDETQMVRLNAKLTRPGFDSPGIGLSNVSRRLRLVYGEESHLTLGHSRPHGTVVTLRIPCVSKEDLKARINPASLQLLNQVESETA